MKSSPTLDRAYQLCREITVGHYENFPVASILLPRHIRKHVYPIYAFARHADDLADEAADKQGLLEWRRQLHQCEEEANIHPIFMALADTIRKFQLPMQLFDDLLSAFIQDLEKTRYADIAELLDYCRCSANPVGRIILYLHGYDNQRLQRYSDHICTALQLTNFWQDIKLDLQKDRIYIPRNYMQKFEVSEQNLNNPVADDNLKKLLASLIQFTRDLYRQGQPLFKHIQGRLKLELKFTVWGGLTILKKIERRHYNVLKERPQLTNNDWLKITFNLITRRNGVI